MTAAQIKAIRLKAGLSQARFGKAIGTTQTRISVWEMGWQQISPVYAREIARVFPEIEPLKPEEND